MESHDFLDSQDPLDSLIPAPDMSAPETPEPSHAPLPDTSAHPVSKLQSNRMDTTHTDMTPPPSTQVPPTNRSKTRTPTPPISHMSTPPPTVELPDSSQRSRSATTFVTSLTPEELESASLDDLKTKVVELQTALHDANMAAAHHKLQYRMLYQESAAERERMAVEARMAQSENEVLYLAEQARAAATPSHNSPSQHGLIPVEKDHYQTILRMNSFLADQNTALKHENTQLDSIIERQDAEIASLSDKVTLMRERIRENREHLQNYRRRVDATPRSTYATPHRSNLASQQQPFAALLQASEMASQESARAAPARAMPGKKGHARNSMSMSSLPSTPQRLQKLHPQTFSTPSGRRRPVKVPSTAPMPRTSALRTPDVYAQSSLPVSQTSPPAPLSDGTVSASDREDNDNDSEAETEIIDPEEISESQASRAASQMLRSSQEKQAKQDSFSGRGMLEGTGSREKLRQTKLFGQVRKANADREDGPPTKRARTGESLVGLGIAGVRD